MWEVMHGLCSTVGNGGLGVGGDAWAVQYQTPCEYCHLQHKG